MYATLQELNAAHGAALVPGDPAAAPLHYGDASAEAAAIAEGAGLLPLEGAGVLLVRGPEAGAFLNSVTTNNVATLPVGQAQPTLICATKGKVLFELTLVHTKPEEFLVVTAPGERDGVAGHLDFYHVREELQMGNVGLVRLDLLGPAAADALRAVGADPASVSGRFGEGPLVTAPLPLGALPRVLALLPPATAPALVQALLDARPPARLVGFQAAEEARIWAGVPRYGADFDRDHLPAEAVVYDHIAFGKGCYVGQEIHARMHYRGHPNRKLMALEIPAEAAAGLAPGAALYAGDEAVGQVTSLTRTARDGVHRAIAMVRYRIVQEGTALATAPGGAATLLLLPLATDLARAAS